MIKKNEAILGASLIFLEVAILLTLFSFLPNLVIAGIGSPSTTVVTNLTIGNVWPEVLEVFVNDADPSLALSPATTTTVYCIGVIRDYNGENDFVNANATFFDTTVSTYNAADDNNYHYTNSSCNITKSFGSYQGYTDDEFHALANCSFEVEYYANAQSWECRVDVNDTMNWEDNRSDTITISPLLALGLPDVIDYGTVDATYVSDENVTNVTNYGNVQINLTLEGYGIVPGDGIAMNCTKGNVGNISIEYEKYNLSATTAGAVSLSEFEASYINLTSAPVSKRFELAARTNDATNDAIKKSYWRIYVPMGVAGTCQGNIIFGATQANGS